MASCKQVVFGILNLIFFILGLVVLGIGIYSKIQDDNWRDILKGDIILQAANIMIAAGLFVALLGFFGCFGAWKQNWVCLAIYAGLFLIIFVLQIAAGIYAYTNRSTIEGQLKVDIMKAVKESYGGTNTAQQGVTKAVDWFQKKLKCCGSNSSKDWQTSKWYTNQKTVGAQKVPESCCVTNNCNRTLVIGNYYKSGCIAEGIKYAKDNLALIGGIGVGIAVVELLGIICAIVLAKEYREQGNIA